MLISYHIIVFSSKKLDEKNENYGSPEKNGAFFFGLSDARPRIID
jgi:hypothetical protein